MCLEHGVRDGRVDMSIIPWLARCQMMLPNVMSALSIDYLFEILPHRYEKDPLGMEIY